MVEKRKNGRAAGDSALPVRKVVPFARRSKILQELRELRGLGVRELAALAGTSHSAIVRYESGERDWMVETLVAIAKGLGISTDILTGREEIPSIEELEIAADPYPNRRVLRRQPEFKAAHPDVREWVLAASNLGGDRSVIEWFKQFELGEELQKSGRLAELLGEELPKSRRKS